jgi:Flp pilus assembly protein TadD
MGICGCTAAAPGVEVRAIANPSAAISRSGDALAVARGQLMLGNVGLALEAFRKAQRDNPADPAVLAGIGDCYSAMSRFDLAQTNYEAALALAPHDRKLLLGLAAIYDREGMTARAMIARVEAAAGLPQPTASTAAVVPQGEPRVPARLENAKANTRKSAQKPEALPKTTNRIKNHHQNKSPPLRQIAYEIV